MAEVRVDMDEAVAVVTLTAPERRNALTHSMALELLDALDAVDADSGERAAGRARGGFFTKINFLRAY